MNNLTKPHYEVLDGLRGVAALIVIWYHVFEGFATGPITQTINHGYLAVDFFFILSGFVISYAYDDRWSTMSVSDFMRRRIIRLHPMVLLGICFGAITFIIQGCEHWDGTKVALTSVLGAMVLHFFMIPALPGHHLEVRGNGEMFPLNGPMWSLFFEYIGSICYALIIRKMSTKTLIYTTTLLGVLLAAFGVMNFSGSGHLGVGWTLSDYNLPGGLLRMLFSFSMGMVMARIFKPVKVRGAFWLCALVLLILLPMPYAGTESTMWTNGLYDAACIIIVFPALVWLGASGSASNRLCRFLGDISYPLYIVHYPLMYLFYSWLWTNGLTFAQTWHVAIGLFLANLLLAYICFKIYDVPVRRWLSARHATTPASKAPVAD